MVTVQAMPCPPTLLAVSSLHCVTGADAALAAGGVWLINPNASRAAARAITILVRNHFPRKPTLGVWETVVVSPECQLPIGTSDALRVPLCRRFVA